MPDTGSRASVVHLLWSGEVGGIERLVVSLAKTQAERGVRVGVMFGRPSGPFFETSFEDGRLEVFGAGFRSGRDLSPARLRPAARFLSGFDVLHVHAYAPPLMAAARMAGRPVVCSLHGPVRPTPGLADRLTLRARAAFVRGATLVAANSAFTRGSCAPRLRLDEASVRVIPNGVERPASTGSALGEIEELRREGTRLVVGVLTRLVWWKHAERAVEAVARTSSGARVGLVVAGDGPCADDLRSLVRTSGIEDRVRFLGFESRIGDFLRQIDVLVHPAQAEGFGLAIAEAALCGTPVAAFSDGGGAVEVANAAGGEVVDDEAALTLLLETWASEGIPATVRPDAERLREVMSMEAFAAAFEDAYAEAGDSSR